MQRSTIAALVMGLVLGFIFSTDAAQPIGPSGSYDPTAIHRCIPYSDAAHPWCVALDTDGGGTSSGPLNGASVAGSEVDPLSLHSTGGNVSGVVGLTNPDGGEIKSTARNINGLLITADALTLAGRDGGWVNLRAGGILLQLWEAGLVAQSSYFVPADSMALVGGSQDEISLQSEPDGGGGKVCIGNLVGAGTGDQWCILTDPDGGATFSGPVHASNLSSAGGGPDAGTMGWTAYYMQHSYDSLSTSGYDGGYSRIPEFTALSLTANTTYEVRGTFFTTDYAAVPANQSTGGWPGLRSTLGGGAAQVADGGTGRGYQEWGCMASTYYEGTYSFGGQVPALVFNTNTCAVASQQGINYKALIYVGTTGGTLTFDFKNQTGDAYPMRVFPSIVEMRSIPVSGWVP